MYYFDNRKHQMPHIHLKCGDDEAVISIPEGGVIEGSIRSNKLRLAQAWVEIHQDELMRNWGLAVAVQKLSKIEPLR